MGGVVKGTGDVMTGGVFNKGVQKTLWGGQPEANFDGQYMARPDWLLTDEKGNLRENFKLSDGSGYTKSAQDRLGTDIAKSRDEAALASAGAQGQARNQLASRGGLSGGMAALLANTAQTNQMNAQQDITGQNIRGQQDINKNTYDIGREAEKYNLGNALQLGKSKYETDMKEWGANQTSNSMLANAPRPKGGILGGATQGIGGLLGKG